MIGKAVTLAAALVGAAPLIALAGAAHARQDAEKPAPELTQTCHFTRGGRAGTTVDFSGTAGAPAVPVGRPCADMTGSNGVAVPASGLRTPSQGRFYRSPGAPIGTAPNGQARAGFTLMCRFEAGPRAGSTYDFSSTLGAAPIRVGSPCSLGPNKGVGVAPGM